MINLDNLVQINGVADSFPEVKGDRDFWTQFSIAEKFIIPEQKPDIEQLAEVVVNVKIISHRVVKTPNSCGCNLAGDNLTGKKLVIEGILEQKFFYVADRPQQSVHAAYFQVPFSTFIIVPPQINLQAKFKIEPYVEDVLVRLESVRKIFKNVTLFLRAVYSNCQKN